MTNLFMFDAGYLANEPAPKAPKPMRAMPAAWSAFEAGDLTPESMREYFSRPAHERLGFADWAKTQTVNKQIVDAPAKPLKLEVGMWVNHAYSPRAGKIRDIDSVMELFFVVWRDGGGSWHKSSYLIADAPAAELKLEVGARIRMHGHDGLEGEIVEVDDKTISCVVFDDGKHDWLQPGEFLLIPRDLPLGWHRVKAGEPWPEFGREVIVTNEPSPLSCMRASSSYSFCDNTTIERYWRELPENGGPK